MISVSTGLGEIAPPHLLGFIETEVVGTETRGSESAQLEVTIPGGWEEHPSPASYQKHLRPERMRQGSPPEQDATEGRPSDSALGQRIWGPGVRGPCGRLGEPCTSLFPRQGQVHLEPQGQVPGDRAAMGSDSQAQTHGCTRITRPREHLAHGQTEHRKHIPLAGASHMPDQGAGSLGTVGPLQQDRGTVGEHVAGLCHRMLPVTPAMENESPAILHM